MLFVFQFNSGVLKGDIVSFGTVLFSHFENSSLQPEIKVHLEIHFNFRSVLLNLQLFTKKPVFECPFAHPMILFERYFSRLCNMQISYEMVSNAHVCQLSVFL